MCGHQKLGVLNLSWITICSDVCLCDAFLYLWRVLETVSLHGPHCCHHVRILGAFLGMKRVVSRSISPFPPKLRCDLPVFSSMVKLPWISTFSSLFPPLLVPNPASVSNSLSCADAEVSNTTLKPRTSKWSRCKTFLCVGFFGFFFFFFLSLFVCVCKGYFNPSHFDATYYIVLVLHQN